MADDRKPEMYQAANRAWWDAAVPIHVASRGYDREGFLRGGRSLSPVEVAELGPHVSGKSLLHLQCHFGMDSLDWARLGAEVTGLDLSEPAIEAARALSTESRIPGRFLCADVMDAPGATGRTFDVVYTGVGALLWLPDIRRWARAAAACVRPGGILYLYDGHPMLLSLVDVPDDHTRGHTRGHSELRVASPYFERQEPTASDNETTYVDGPPMPVHRTYSWNHGLGELLTAIIDAGLRIDFVHEHKEVPWRALAAMEPVGVGPSGADGRYQSQRLWRLPEPQRDWVPLMVSVLATRPAR